jgi:tetratricopeptide (TPR) repeat protein
MAETPPLEADGPRTPATPGSGTVAAGTDSPPRLPHTPPDPQGSTTTASVPALVGRFRLGVELARGGMGVVYRAHEPSVGRDVAVKVLHDEFRGDDRMAARFVAEACITAQLQHPGIPPVFEVGQLPDGSPFLAMKLIKGYTLAELLRERPDPSHDRGRFVAVFEQVCQAVGYAHAHGVVHRDLKPHNVMVGAHGEVQVMDWGLAKVLAESGRPVALGPADSAFGTDIRSDRDSALKTRVGAVMGTPAFMPREQAIGAVDQIDQRSDVFGLGAILCVVLTGSPPYAAPDGESARQMAAVGQLDDAFARLDACRAEPGLVALCKRCLSPEKADRPADGDAVARAIAALRAAAEERARRAEVARAEAELREVEGRKRRRVQWVLAAAVGLLAVGAVALAQERQFKKRQAREGIEAALKLSTDLSKQYRFREAADALEQAAQLAAGAPELAERVERAKADLTFVRELDDIRMKRTTYVSEPGGEGRYDAAGAARDYPEAFRGRGLDVLGVDPGAVAEAVVGSPIRSELVAALDDWAALLVDDPTGDRVLGVLRRADPGPWLDAFRDPAVRRNRMALGLLARSADPAAVHPATLTSLAVVLVARGLDPSRLLLLAQSAHPGDFLIAFQLGGWHYYRKTYDDAIAYYRVARVIRPGDWTVLNDLGSALAKKGDVTGAEQAYREAIRLAPYPAQTYTNLGNARFWMGDVDGALEACREAIRLDPKLVHAHNNLGNALVKKGDVAGAVAEYREATRLDPKYAIAHNGLGAILEKKGEVDGAIAEYREAVRLDPKLAKAHYNLGVSLAKKGDTDGAVAAWREAIGLGLKYATAHYNLGVALGKKGEPDGAIAEYREAIRLDPKSPAAHTGLGNALFKKGDADGAVAAFREAVRLDPKDANAHDNLGAALHNRGDADGAVAALREATRLDPKSFGAHYNLGLALKVRKDSAGAVAAFRVAVRLNPNHVPACRNLAFALFGAGDADGAAAAFRELTRLAPKDEWAHANLGFLLNRKGDHAAAAACYREVVRLAPTSAKFRWEFGEILWAGGDRDGALAQYREGARVEPASARAHAELGGALLRAGEVGPAVERLREAVLLDPGDAAAHYKLGNALRDWGDAGGAIAEYHEATRLDPKYAPAHTDLGIVYLGQKKYPEAIACARAAIRADPYFAHAHALLGHLLQLTGDLSGARAALTEAARLDLKQWGPWYAKLPPLDIAPPPRPVGR